MKHQLIPSRKTLPLATMVCFFLFFTACQNDGDGPSLSCPEMKMSAIIGGRERAMTLTNSIIFRSKTDSGGHKLLNMESISDTFKVVFNLTDGMYNENALKNDSIHLDTFRFSRLGPQNGLVAVGFMNNSGSFDLLTTDTSNIIIRKINTQTQTISGSFFFIADNQTVTGGGSFENACYVSLQ
ncbi:hypothetical protein [Chitinophaga sp.]|uniref:hypothetical protein n=1 Tax=Chitinophaga sp. TaxID=1869181 RepID=UPI002F932412